MGCADCAECAIAGVPEGGPEVPHQIHITLPVRDRRRLRVAEIPARSLLVGIKMMEIVDPSGRRSLDVFTNSSFIGSDAGAIREMIRIADGFERHNWSPTRVKIESAPWHPRASLGPGGAIPDDCYLESHIGLWIREDLLSEAANILYGRGAYLSVNVLKDKRPSRNVGVPLVRASATVRGIYRTRDQQDEDADQVRAILQRHYGEVDTVVRTEFTWMDLAENPDMAGGPPQRP